MLKSFCTIATSNYIKNLLVLCKSKALFFPDIPIVVLCDQETEAVLRSETNDDKVFIRPLPFTPDLDSISSRGTQYCELQLQKPKIIAYCIETFENTLFVDCDIIFLNHFDLETKNDVILSRHHIFKKDELKYGKYNGGYLFVQNLDFPSWWTRAATEQSKFFEQECLNYANQKFKVGQFSINHNFGWWRLFHTKHPKFRKKMFRSNENIYYKWMQLMSVHTHIVMGDKHYKSNSKKIPKFNKLILRLMAKSKYEKHQELLEYINSVKHDEVPGVSK